MYSENVNTLPFSFTLILFDRYFFLNKGLCWHAQSDIMNNFNDLVDALKTIVNDFNWQNVGNVKQFQIMKCYK